MLKRPAKNLASDKENAISIALPGYRTSSMTFVFLHVKTPRMEQTLSLVYGNAPLTSHHRQLDDFFRPSQGLAVGRKGNRIYYFRTYYSRHVLLWVFSHHYPHPSQVQVTLLVFIWPMASTSPQLIVTGKTLLIQLTL
ncbi:unnamed protein product [Allacma fusca]|uniref:Uncharacterized protein n=1 Tax=Allacma fusca TaxID=39272 RepID=A0A8J2J3Y9_9HEXA|nr:unnamed protein product [Allacma fusca]